MMLVAALAISAVVLAAQSPRAALHSVTAVRHWTLREATRVAIEVSGDFHFKTDRLHNPERVYFDIVDARPRIGARRFYAESFDDKLVTKVRVAETTPGTTRIVFDLTSPSIEASTSQLSNPNRLIVELRIAGGAPPPTLV